MNKRLNAFLNIFREKNKREPTRDEQHDIKKHLKTDHDAVTSTSWPAVTCRRTPEACAPRAYEKRLLERIVGFRELGVDKIAARVGVGHRTVRRLLTTAGL